ncbi:MAG: hypothetical protein U0457_15900 [Candidatus Sericytochromatia bacterium]
MKAILFVDLDETIFQTKIKNRDGFLPVTNVSNPKYTSYMTPAQTLLWDIFIEHPSLSIIPVTLRGLREYNNTQVSKNPKVITSVLYFSGVITHNDYADEVWANHIKSCFLNLKMSLGEVFKELVLNLRKDFFRVELVDNFYISIKNVSVGEEEYINQNKALIKVIKKKIINDDYLVYSKNRSIIVLPKFLNKRNSVQYLINKYKPDLTIGAGNSVSDWSFMDLCDYKLIPRDSQLEAFINNEVNNYEQ